MICPLRFKEFSTEDAMQAGQRECALLVHWEREVEVTDTHAKDDRGKAVNHAYGEWKERGGR